MDPSSHGGTKGGARNWSLILYSLKRLSSDISNFYESCAASVYIFALNIDCKVHQRVLSIWL